MMTRTLRATWGFLAILAGCSSPAPSTSSSSHWVSCVSVSDCSTLAAAVACSQGYCVDASGGRIESGSNTAPSPTAPSPCDPLAPHEPPVTLGTVLGVGQDGPQGLVYMADQVQSTSTNRVFVSAGDTLFRKRVLGTSTSSGDGDLGYTFTFNVGDFGDQDLLIQLSGGNTTSMALGPGAGKPSVVMRSLTVLDPSAISSFTLRNLPGDVTVEYAADVENGDVIVVLHPTDDYVYEDFRVFYGKESAMLERQVEGVTRSKGSDTDVRFLVGSAHFVAHFSFEIAPSDAGVLGHRGPASLDTGGSPLLSVSERDPVPSALPGFSFSCIH